MEAQEKEEVPLQKFEVQSSFVERLASEKEPRLEMEEKEVVPQHKSNVHSVKEEVICEEGSHVEVEKEHVSLFKVPLRFQIFPKKANVDLKI